ncbi:MAG: 4a-hydroxytetrahydrobiopterin dehydratase [Acidimicrobiia bacterium]|nr:4a-hydroxytetrahydrobiopterin dehydratase [Acidimicrobiia bacterium]NNF09106.1 4a-hydroxytetrahydrobiopterin dehydratase [Acidimicrobiia bacterium]NNL69469.1 4a-hydroxytetrahydrobiopterin dehydratase [Acidimicrobiia bacterium]
MQLTDAEWEEFATAHPAWERDGESIRRTFVHDDFTAAVGFVVRVGFLAEAADHHPDIDIRWNKVTLDLSTHSEGELTEKDTNLASQIDEI